MFRKISVSVVMCISVCVTLRIYLYPWDTGKHRKRMYKFWLKYRNKTKKWIDSNSETGGACEVKSGSSVSNGTSRNVNRARCATARIQRLAKTKTQHKKLGSRLYQMSRSKLQYADESNESQETPIIHLCNILVVRHWMFS